MVKEWHYVIVFMTRHKLTRVKNVWSYWNRLLRQLRDQTFEPQFSPTRDPCVHVKSIPDAKMLSLWLCTDSGSTSRLWELMPVVVPLRNRFNHASSCLNGRRSAFTIKHTLISYTNNHQFIASKAVWMNI